MIKVVAIIVTYNRKKKLYDCISSIKKQSLPCDILIIDNASKDGTLEFITKKQLLNDNHVNYLELEKNEGGSKGFKIGLERSLKKKYDWFWMMDDDAIPDKKALEKLFEYAAINKNNIYGSVAVEKVNGRKKLCFPTKTISEESRKRKYKTFYEDLKEVEQVAWIPFLGFLIHRDNVQEIGFPDPGFFILDDDIEYSERARKFGIKILQIKDSVVWHPLPKESIHIFLGNKIIYQSMPPWKTYYGVRNKIIVAKRYYGKLLWTQTLPGIIFRLFCSVYYEKKRAQLFYAYVKGIFDGFSNRMGKRYEIPF